MHREVSMIRRRTLSSALPALLGSFALVACGPDGPSMDEICAARLPGDLVISEFMANPSGEDSKNEWIEIFNASGAEIDLAGMTLYNADPTGGAEKKHTFKAVKLPAGNYLAMGDVDGDLPPHLGYSYGSSLGARALRNTGGTIGIRCAAKLIDEVKYDTAADGRSTQLSGDVTPDAIINDQPVNWCSTPKDQLYDGKNAGTPGRQNSACGETASGNCIDAVTGTSRPIVFPAVGELFITELMPDPSAVGDTDGEWVEVHALADVDLNGVTFAAGNSTSTVNDPTCVRMTPGSFAVIARNSDEAENGGLPRVDATYNVTLGNSGGTLTVSAGATILDEVTWASARAGTSLQLSSDLSGPQDNDLPGAFCDATEPYGLGDRGTPGSQNAACPPVVQPGECVDASTSAVRAIQKPQPGELVITEVMPNPKAVADTAGEWFEITALAPFDLNELLLSNGGASPVEVKSGHCLRLEPGSFALIARSGNPANNGGLPFVTYTAGLSLTNSNGTVAVSDGATVLHQVTWTSSPDGASLQLDPAKLGDGDRDDMANFCAATTPYGAGDLGSPGDANASCDGGGPVGQCMDSGSGTLRDPVKPQPGDLVITEVMPNPAAVDDALGEFIEVLVLADVDLNGLQLGNEASGNSQVASSDCLPVTAGDYLLFARSADPAQNGDLPEVTATFGFNIANTGTRAAVLRMDGTELDRVEWSSSAAGASLQLSPTALDPVSNDDPANWCTTPTGTTYGAGDRGTPKAANVACP